MLFAEPYFLIFVIFIILYIIFLIFRLKKKDFSEATIYFPALNIFKKNNNNFFSLFKFIDKLLILLSIIFFIIALSRPLGGSNINTIQNYGIDIMLAFDVSGSMLSIDKIPSDIPYRDVYGQRIYYDLNKRLIKYNRLSIAKDVLKKYVEKQEFNRIGITVFAGYSYTLSPLTIDKNMLIKIIDNIEYNPKNDGTAIGMGIVSAVNRLRKSSAKSKIIILLTDGINNRGLISPEQALEIAKKYNIKIYTIGLGNPDGYLFPVNLEFKEYLFQNEEGIDEVMMKKIAETTGGKYYRAYDGDALYKIYDDIDRLEKSKINIKRKVLYKENFITYIIIGLLLLLIYLFKNLYYVYLP